MAADQAVQALTSDAERGLSADEVLTRQTQFGSNRLTPRPGKSPLRLLLSQFHQPLVYILVAAGATTAFLDEWVDATVIFGVVVVNAVIGFIQEANALRAINALSQALSINATVVRDELRQGIAADSLVPGDIVFLQSGDKVPADMRLLSGRELQIDESALTGESIPVRKTVESLAETVLLADRTNMAYSSTLVTSGTGMGLVAETGDRTEIGKINRMIASATELETPLTRKLAQFSRLLLWIILGFAALTFWVGWQRGESALDMFKASVALAVGAIPEGLPAALTITLAIGVSRMAKRNAIIRKLPAVETLGGTTVICSDKTGTLTQNRMTVQAIYAGGERFAVGGDGDNPQPGQFLLHGTAVDPQDFAALMECLRAGVLCNDARLIGDGENCQTEGDPTEGALLIAARHAGFDPGPARSAQPRLDAIPFESEHQYMATLHPSGAANNQHIYLKGSVESVVPRCVDAFDPRLNRVALCEDEVLQQVENLTARGFRVLAFAWGERASGHPALDHDDVVSGLTLIGLQAMIDPPRPEAARSIRACHQAGIAVKMITGDHPGTALAIARQLGLVRTGRLHRLFRITPSARVVTGAQLQNLNEADYPTLVRDCDIYARIAPEQKLRLVRALQANGEVVAMTGDGVNDAPALRQADIGVAMGHAGTEVAKEAAAMVLTDDHFATIEAAVEEGRGVFDNLVKFIAWTLPTNIGEGLVITAAVFAGVALPITPVQILWINMTTAVLLGLMLAFEPKEPGLMLRKPRSPSQPILTRRLISRVLVVGLLLLAGSFGLFRWELNHGESLASARTVAANVFVIGELFYLFNCRSLSHSMFYIGLWSNPWVIAGANLQIALQLLFTYWPPMNRLFGTEPIGAEEWLLITACGLCIYWVIGLEKWGINRFVRAGQDRVKGGLHEIS